MRNSEINTITNSKKEPSQSGNKQKLPIDFQLRKQTKDRTKQYYLIVFDLF
jgi:hypothetical protein